MASTSYVHLLTVILWNVPIWKRKVHKRRERSRNLQTSENMSSRSPQILFTEQQHKTVVRWMIEEAEICGSEKKISSKAVQNLLQFLERTTYGRKDAVFKKRTDGTQAGKSS